MISVTFEAMQGNKLIYLFGGPLSFALCALFIPSDSAKVIGIISWMLLWWITEVVPMGVTSLLPIILFPITGVLSLEKTTVSYGNKYVFLFMGGFIIALAMEKWNLHKRLALEIVKRTGSGANNIILGFLLSSYIISMWISNTATALMMFPIALSVVHLLLGSDKKLHGKGQKNFAIAIMLSIAYGSSIGGIATLVGSPPNAAMAGILSSDVFLRDVGFFEWMKIGLPFSIALLLITYLILTKISFPNKLGSFKMGNDIITQEYEALGAWTSEQKKVFFLFLFTAACWMFEEPLSKLLANAHLEISDVGIAMISSVLLFVLPSSKKSEKLLDWEDTARLPWGVLLMFGGGLALAEAFRTSGLIEQLTDLIRSINHLDTFIFVSGLCFIGLVLTALMSNLAMVNIFVPVVGALAVGMGKDPALFAIPVTIAASCDFMFPMSTPPNAIAYSSGYVKSSQMFKAGIWINIASQLLLMALLYFLV